MALVGVEHLRRCATRKALVDAQRLHAAHSQQQLLLEAVVAAAAVQTVRNAAGGVVVARHIRIEQQQGNTPDVGTPDVCQQPAPVGKRQ
ncbi:hypothetical protein D9M72_466850 [compost metagenome]